jgi:hypothetical protein
MSDENFQLANDPAAMEHVAKVQAELSGKVYRASIEMHSGRTYSGIVSGTYFGERSGSKLPRSVGGYILIDVNGARLRLDALDIKSWAATPV